MPARLRPRLTYANVVSTLALFAALGGSAVAVTQITSSQVKNRSLRGIDLRKNSVTGKEVKEKTLGRVNNARSALSAATAASADAARTAANAAVAATANDAQALNGQSGAAYEKSSRTQFGRASISPALPENEQVLLEWSQLGARISTASNNGGCVAGKIGLRFRNTRTSGPQLHFFEQGVDRSTLDPGAQSIICSSSNTDHWTGAAGDSSGRSLFFECQNVEGDVRCLGTRSEP